MTDTRNPLTYCAHCQVEHYGHTQPGSHGICQRHAREMLAEADALLPHVPDDDIGRTVAIKAGPFPKLAVESAGCL